MKTQEFTKLESQVLRSFIPTQNVFDFGENVQTINNISALVFDNESELLMPNQIKGILGSLVKKQILEVEDHEENGSNFIYFHDSFYQNEEKLNQLIESIK